MLALMMLFRPAPRRQFVLLDAEQRCLVMRCARQCPAVGNWVEVSEFSLCWLGQPLPRGAVLSPVATRRQWSLAS